MSKEEKAPDTARKSQKSTKSSPRQKKKEEGEIDSDDDFDKRILNMRDPTKRKFNENDILGDFDRDEKGNIIIQQNGKGENIDKKGRMVNEKGYLIQHP